jgi:hypothetical protein
MHCREYNANIFIWQQHAASRLSKIKKSGMKTPDAGLKNNDYQVFVYNILW